MTAFHLAYDEGHSNIVNMLIHKAKEFNIDLNAKHTNDRIDFSLA